MESCGLAKAAIVIAVSNSHLRGDSDGALRRFSAVLIAVLIKF